MRIATVFACCFTFAPFSHMLEEPLDIEHLSLQHHAAVFVAGEVEQVFHDALEMTGFAIDRLDMAVAALGVERDLEHAQRFNVSAHRSESRSQIRVKRLPSSAGAAHRMSKRRLAGLQLIGHAVERRRDPRDFVASVLWCARRPFPLSKLLHAMLQR